MTVAAYVGTTPARSESGRATIDAIRQCTILVDDPPSGGSWNNVRRALELPCEAEWKIICDDDIVPCRNFLHEADRALSFCPGDIASLAWFWRSSPVKEAMKAGASWIETAYFVYGCCFAVRAHLCAEAVEWTSKHLKPGHTVGDAAVSAWAADSGYLCYGLVPSIVEHNDTMPSVAQPGIQNADMTVCELDDDPSSREWNRKSVWYGKTAEDYLASIRKAGWLQ